MGTDRVYRCFTLFSNNFCMVSKQILATKNLLKFLLNLLIARLDFGAIRTNFCDKDLFLA